MNLSLKNPFAAKATPSTDDRTETGSPLDDAQRTVKRWQLERGRTNAKMESLTADLDTARADLAHATQAHGENLYEGKDSTATALEAQRARNQVAALESAVKIAVEKDDLAQAELQEAERTAERAIDDEATAAFLAAVADLEFLLCDAVNRAVKEVAATHQAVAARCQGDTQTMYQLGKFLSYYPTYLHYYQADLIAEGRRRVHDIHEEHKTLHDQAEAVRYAMNRRRRS